MLHYRFLCYHPKTDRLHLIGYPLTLSKTDRTILIILLKQGGTAKLDALFPHCPYACKRVTLAVHFHRINRQAALISRRPLVFYKNGVCYLNPYM